MSWDMDDNLREKLLAYADGELPGEQSDELRRYLTDHPEASRWLDEQAELMRQIQTQLTRHAPPASTHLRESIVALPMSAPRKPLRVPTHFAWLTAAAAVLIVIWLTVVPHGSTAVPSVVPAQTIAFASHTHALCSRLEERLHSAEFPADRGKLAADIERDLSTTSPRPDLASIGFHYTGAGPCGGALSDTIHLLYHSDRPGSIATISLFVQPNTGQFNLEAWHVYSATGPEAPFPMLVWRSDSVVYFLIADNDRTEQEALKLIRAGHMIGPATQQ